MKTLIVYAGKSGATRELVDIFREAAVGEVEAVDVKRGKVPAPAAYDSLIIGGAVYAGSVDKRLRRYCEEHNKELKGKKLGLFLCSLREEDAEANFAHNFPKEVRDAAAVQEWLGGRFIFRDHNLVIRGLMKKIMDSTEDVDNIRREAASQLAREVG